MKIFCTLSSSLILGLVVVGCGNNKPANPSGSLEATEVDVVSTIPARIAQIRADLGDRVTSGDTLVVLDTELLRLQRAQAETNRRALRAQREVLNDQLEQGISQQRLAEITFERTQNLLKQGSATQQQFDEAQTKRDVATTQVSTIRNQIDALRAEEEKLNASLAVFDRQLAEGVIRAPISGTVILRSSEPGEMATPGSVLLRLADLRTLDLRIFLSEADVGKVKIGQKLSVLVDAYQKESFSGTVTWVSPEAEFTPKNAQTREARTQLVYAVKLRVENPDGRLHIGMPVEVKLTES